VRAARRCHTASGRRKTGRFLAEGEQAAREALATPGAVVEVLATREWLGGRDALRLPDVPVHAVSDRVLATVAETEAPQGVVAVCRDVTVTLDALLERRPRLVVVLAEVRDPGNVGTIIRTADAAGADGVVLTRASVDPLGGKCVRASVGSVFHLPIVTGQAVDVLPRLRDAGLRVLAADATATTSIADPDAHALLADGTAWVVGNEAHGLPAAYADAADDRVAVPLYGRAESLNVSVATALCLYASAQAQRQAQGEEGSPPDGARPSRH
jgi:TrmH family RNA methyltransferase